MAVKLYVYTGNMGASHPNFNIYFKASKHADQKPFMNSPILVLTTFPDIDTAQRLAQAMVEEKLAACVNIMPAGQSIYAWEGKICKESEHLAVIKSMDDRYQELETFIQQQHPYELPEIIMTQINNGSKKYLDWLTTNTRL